jgi:hypothetical protein
VQRLFGSRVAGLTWAMIYVLSSQEARAEPEPVPSPSSPSDGDDVASTAEAAPSANVAESPPAPANAKAKAIWEERPVANEDAKHPPIVAASVQSDETEGNGYTSRFKAWTLSVALAHDSLSGDDFDDSQVLVRQEPGYAPEVTVLPELGSGSGFSVGLGYGHFPNRVGSFGIWAGLSYSATWFGVSSTHTGPLEKAVLHDLDFPLRCAYRVSRHFVPHLQASYGLGFLDIQGVHGSLDEGTVWLDGTSSLFVARLLGVGVGSLFPLNDNVSIDAFVGYRVMVVSSIDGVEVDDLTAGGWMLRLGPAIFF